jgi:hypothetical protein
LFNDVVAQAASLRIADCQSAGVVLVTKHPNKSNGKISILSQDKPKGSNQLTTDGRNNGRPPAHV